LEVCRGRIRAILTRSRKPIRRLILLRKAIRPIGPLPPMPTPNDNQIYDLQGRPLRRLRSSLVHPARRTVTTGYPMNRAPRHLPTAIRRSKAIASSKRRKATNRPRRALRTDPTPRGAAADQSRPSSVRDKMSPPPVAPRRRSIHEIWRPSRPRCGLRLVPKKQLPPQFRRTLVDYYTKEPAGTLIIDTPNTYLYLVLGQGKAMRYGIGVGREGFTWAGAERVTKMAEWPDWTPPEEMIVRQPYLHALHGRRETNPLARGRSISAKRLYRIHGTNQPSTIGTFVSSGCIRLTNEDVTDLFTRVKVGTRVVGAAGQAAGDRGGNAHCSARSCGNLRGVRRLRRRGLQ